MRAMILAAGLGSRLAPLTNITPKPLIKINSRPLIEYHIEKLADFGVTTIVVNLHHLGSQIEDYLGNGSNYGVKIIYSHEPELLDTGGGIVKALPLLGEDPFILISSDIFTEYDLNKLPSNLDKLGHIVLTNNPDYHPDGDFGLKNGLVTYDVPKFTYANIALLSPKLFLNSPQGKFPLAISFRQAIDKQQLSGSYSSDIWFNIGTISELDKANQCSLVK